MDQDMNKLINDVEQWFDDKGITKGPKMATPLSQHKKMQEEVDELRAELVTLRDDIGYGRDSKVWKTRERAIDELGDVIVTAIGVAKLLGVTPHEALSVAYEKISKRGGEMIDGVFVKNKETTQSEQ